MRTSEQRFRTWKLPREVPTKSYITNITYDFSVLQFTIADGVTDKPFLAIRFLFPIAHRVLNESYRLRSMSQLSSISLIGVVQNSDFQTWVRDESLDAWSFEEINHFVVCDAEWVADVLIEGEPELVWTDVSELTR